MFSLSVYRIYIRPLELFSRFKIFFIISFVHFSCSPCCWWFFSSARAKLKIIICSNTCFKASIEWFLQDLFWNEFFQFEMLLSDSKWFFPIRNDFFFYCRLGVGSIILDGKRKIASELTVHMKLCTTFIIWIFKVEKPRDRTSEINSHTKRKSLEMQLKMAISHICDKVMMMMMMIRWETVKETENHTENKTYKRITYTHLTWHKKTCKRTQRWLTPKPNLNGRVFLSLHNTSAFFVAPFLFCFFSLNIIARLES